MIVTEEQAKTKWCPFVRHHNALFEPCGNSLASMPNRETHPTFSKCIAYQCMAWRGRLEQSGMDEPVYKGRGYCGLAGAP